ncbi:hypothetical protein CHLNCDRAFT_142852 [Chlorella variabilis]|uniref:50S ribosomal protein L18 n=1 Tax=Chlorella variabilis TaxID=554065 RepID=E1Z8W9_CHLVA|nr:hypothetical protein CHLNCDRAFT_142852 [Chlorella variabilis]EFN57679.1 hypothetical protein CHLNCDRAFT_142852 [Chlorella variabilis]|eukprot:XP_005849781.1 hypothetical protein CHLNCDRAFT_142852 [Chlorella variabilis]
MFGLPPLPLLVVQPFHLKLFLSNKYIYGQIWRAADQHVVAAASTIEAPVREALKEAGASASCSQAASRVGQLLAERAQKAGVSGVTWPRRRGESYHGKRKALLDAMREAGLPLI